MHKPKLSSFTKGACAYTRVDRDAKPLTSLTTTDQPKRGSFVGVVVVGPATGPSRIEINPVVGVTALPVGGFDRDAVMATDHDHQGGFQTFADAVSRQMASQVRVS